MNHPVSRRNFTTTMLALAGAATLPEAPSVYGAPQSGTKPKTPKKALRPLTINVTPEAFESRYGDLGGVLDLSNGVIWGYEPYASMVNYGINYMTASQVDDNYKTLLAARANSSDPTEAALFAEALAVADMRSWRWPTVFEARAAVEKGLFTFGPGGCNLFYGAPDHAEPGVSYSVYHSRWSSSTLNDGRVHLWSAGDGGTHLTVKSSAVLAIVVSKL